MGFWQQTDAPFPTSEGISRGTHGWAQRANGWCGEERLGLMDGDAGGRWDGLQRQSLPWPTCLGCPPTTPTPWQRAPPSYRILPCHQPRVCRAPPLHQPGPGLLGNPPLNRAQPSRGPCCSQISAFASFLKQRDAPPKCPSEGLANLGSARKAKGSRWMLLRPGSQKNILGGDKQRLSSDPENFTDVSVKWHVSSLVLPPKSP